MEKTFPMFDFEVDFRNGKNLSHVRPQSLRDVTCHFPTLNRVVRGGSFVHRLSGLENMGNVSSINCLEERQIESSAGRHTIFYHFQTLQTLDVKIEFLVVFGGHEIWIPLTLVVCVSFWSNAGIVLESFRDRFGTHVGTCWNHHDVGIMLGSITVIGTF